MADAQSPLDWVNAASTAIRGMLPTNRHAEMLFEAVQAVLGDRAYTFTTDGRANRWLFRSDPADAEWLIPWPLMKLSVGPASRRGQFLLLVNGEEPAYVPPPKPEGEIPDIEGLGPARVHIFDGADLVSIRYCEDGRSIECEVGDSERARPRVTMPVPKDRGNAVEQLADRVAVLDIERLGPARVRLPVPMPKGPDGVRNDGIRALREACWARRLPESEGFVAIDGVAGTAVGLGATRAAALAAWLAEVRRVRPKPPPPAKEPELTPELQEQIDSGEAILLRGPASDVAFPALTPETTPALLVPLPAPPRPVCPLGLRWVRLIGGKGASSWAAMRRDEHGFTLIGEALLDRIALGELDAQLDAADRTEDGRQAHEVAQRPIRGLPKADCIVVHYEPSGAGKWLLGSDGTRGFDAGGLDGDRIRGLVVRQRWLQ